MGWFAHIFLRACPTIPQISGYYWILRLFLGMFVPPLITDIPQLLVYWLCPIDRLWRLPLIGNRARVMHVKT